MKPLKTIILISALFLFALPSKAQMDFTVQGNAAIPATDYRHAYPTGYGFGAKASYSITDNVFISISGDFINFNNDLTSLIKLQKIPVQLSGEYKFNIKKFHPFVGAGAGLMFHRLIVTDIRANKTKFAANAFVGTQFDVSQKIYLSLNTRFVWDNDSPMFNLSIGAGWRIAY